MTISRKLVIAALSCCFAVTAMAASQKKPNLNSAKAAPTPATAAVDKIATAHALVRYGNANGDPLALITAAKIIKEAGTVESPAKRTGGKPGADKGRPDGYSPDVILAHARELAAGRPDIIALADDVAKTGSRGRDRGPGRIHTVVGSGEVDSFDVVFTGGEPARILVSGDGDSDLDLYVYDENGNLICKDDDNSDDMVCGFTPAWTGKFNVRVRNRGIANEYVLITN
ncbi:hypothetical protein GCM10025771_38830 [Niveibacterium umoris]|uniref:Peptidase C-terminal archaeal/bacterial domain-containing protein n=1 Tax=Niveibacterium umoris TaxID=1193620 RepID=A0A840BCV7_9RHOO|nr:hypothetical protein [Niveibacterium umoris]MBB4010915.1 hypothetical protein [Niveibacterium umoris]